MEPALSYDGTKTSFAKALFKERTERGWTQQHLADMAGVEQSAVSDIECGVRLPHLHSARKIASGLNMTLAELLRKAEL